MSGNIGITGVKIDDSVTAADEQKINYAIGCAVRAKSEDKTNLDIAEYIRDAFDEKHGASWHCMVGTGFTVRHEWNANTRIKFTFGDTEILLFKHSTSSEPKPSPRYYPHISPSDRQKISRSLMDTEMEYHVFDCCRRACEWYSSNDERAKYIKDEFDKEHNGGWNCMLGGTFGYAMHYDHNCWISVNNFGKDNVGKIALFCC